MNEVSPQVQPEPAFDHQPQVGQVELDRYCARCGYNLRQQAVRREPTTQLLLCKCPECGVFEPANQAMTRPRSWFAQLVLLLWLIWIALLAAAVFGAVAITVDLANEMGRVMTQTEYLEVPIEETTSQGHTRTINFQYQVRPLSDDFAWVKLLVFMIAAFFVAAGLIAIAMLFVPHWPRRGYVALALAWPIVSLVVYFGTVLIHNSTLQYATRGLELWIFLSPLLIASLSIVGGLVGVWLTRPIARLVVRILIPARQRGPFAYLWLVDDKTPTATA